MESILTWHYSSLAAANPVVYEIFSNVLDNPLCSHIHSSHLDKSEVQLLERHLRLTVHPEYLTYSSLSTIVFRTMQIDKVQNSCQS